MKTLFLCEYLSDRRLRQEIQEALNVIEQWNSVNGFIFHGKGVCWLHGPSVHKNGV
jgi:TnpA family transposase